MSVQRNLFSRVISRGPFLSKSEENSEKVLTVHFFLCKRYHTFRNLPSKIVLYSIYAIMYVRGNQLTQPTDHRPQTDGHTLNLSYYLTLYISISSLNGVTLWKLIFPILVPHWNPGSYICVYCHYSPWFIYPLWTLLCGVYCPYGLIFYR
jgi:hypothetical protein